MSGTRADSQTAMTGRATAWIMLLAYLTLLALLVFLPFGRGAELGDRLNLDPFETIARALRLGPGSSSFRLMIGNIVAFVPLGILVPLAMRTRGPQAVVLVALVGLAISAGIEAGQYAISQWLGYAYRSTDIDDVILNVAGAVVGAIALAGWQSVRRSSTSS